MVGFFRPQGHVAVSLGFLNTPRKVSSSIRWKRVLLKVSGKSLMGDHTQNVDPEVRTMMLDLVNSFYLLQASM